MNHEEIAAIGASLHRIDRKILKPEESGGQKRIWYQGDEPYFDVFFEIKNSEIVWFQFTFRGKCISWSPELGGMNTGVTNELNIDDVTYYSASKLINNDSTIDWAFIDFARSILQTRRGDDIFDKALALFDN